MRPSLRVTLLRAILAKRQRQMEKCHGDSMLEAQYQIPFSSLFSVWASPGQVNGGELLAGTYPERRTAPH